MEDLKSSKWLGLGKMRTIDVIQVDILNLFEIFFNNTHILSRWHFVGSIDDSIILYLNKISNSVQFGLLKISVDVWYIKVSEITNDFGIFFT